MPEFKPHVQKTGLEDSVQTICGNFTAYGWTEVKVTAACHLFLSKYVESRSEPTRVDPIGISNFKDFEDTVQTGGNCFHKSMFLASLLSHVNNVDVRFVKIKDEPVGHVLVEASFPEKTYGEAATDLYRFYFKQNMTDIRRVLSTPRNGKRWFVADPVMSRYIGDAQQLRKQGYVTTARDSGTWNQPVEHEHL